MNGDSQRSPADPPPATPPAAGSAAESRQPAGGARLSAGFADRMLPRQPLIRHLILAVAAGIVLYFITTGIGSYNDFEVSQIAVYAIAVAGLTLLTGSNGQISLGHGALMAVGAYTTALLIVHTHIPVWATILAGAAAAAVLGIIVGLVAARLRGPYLAGVTLALALALPEVAVKYTGIFGGEQGITVNPLTAPGAIPSEQWLAWVSLIAALAVMILLANLNRSRLGRTFRAVRDDEIAASLAGINVARTQILAFVVSSACAGLAGALYGFGTGIVNPGEFTISLSISLLAGMVIGGAGSLVGAWWGALVLVLVPQWATSLSNTLNLSSGVSSNLALIIYGAVLIVVMILAPSGIQGGVRRLLGLGRLPAARLPVLGRWQAGREGHRAQAEASHVDSGDHIP